MFKFANVDDDGNVMMTHVVMMNQAWWATIFGTFDGVDWMHIVAHNRRRHRRARVALPGR